MKRGFTPTPIRTKVLSAPRVALSTNRCRGFTLIELLVVIAIIGVLSSVVLASLNSAREKSRDARRIADIRQFQIALELYYDTHGEYPISSASLQSEGFIATLPTDPLGGSYPYQAYTSTTISSGTRCTQASETCVLYHLGASLENKNHSVLSSDIDNTDDTALPDGDDADGCYGSSESDRACYDVTS